MRAKAKRKLIDLAEGGNSAIQQALFELPEENLLTMFMGRR